MNAETMAMIGGPEMMMIGVVVLMLFGAKKVPELMKGLGKGIREFKHASREIQDDIQQALEEEPPPPPPARKDEKGGHWTEKTVAKPSEAED